MKLLTPPSFFSQTRLPCISWPSPNWTPDSSHSSLQRPPGRVSLSAQLVFTRLIPSIFVHFSPGGMMPPPHFFLYSSSSIWRPKQVLQECLTQMSTHHLFQARREFQTCRPDNAEWSPSRQPEMWFLCWTPAGEIWYNMHLILVDSNIVIILPHRLMVLDIDDGT